MVVGGEPYIGHGVSEFLTQGIGEFLAVDKQAIGQRIDTVLILYEFYPFMGVVKPFSQIANRLKHRFLHLMPGLAGLQA